MKVKLNPAIEGMSGQLGDLVFREVRGKTVVSRKPVVTAAPTESQTLHRERFKMATAFGRFVMGNAEVRAAYEEAARIKDVPVFALTIADYFNAPSIHSIDLSQYTAQPDSVITVHASDDFAVTEVQVIISDDRDVQVEGGFASETFPGSWVYVARSAIALPTLKIKAIAKDRPGGIATKTETLQRFQEG